VPEPVRAVVAKLLAKASKNRFESARQARAALEQALAPQRNATRGGIVFLPAISDAEPEPEARPRRHTQRGTASLADDVPAPSSTSMSGRSATILADHMPAPPPTESVSESPAVRSGAFGTARVMHSAREPARGGTTGRSIIIVVAVVAVLAVVALAASGAFGASPGGGAAAPRGGDYDG
jgi:hypothetical protein